MSKYTDSESRGFEAEHGAAVSSQALETSDGKTRCLLRIDTKSKNLRSILLGSFLKKWDLKKHLINPKLSSNDTSVKGELMLLWKLYSKKSDIKGNRGSSYPKAKLIIFQAQRYFYNKIDYSNKTAGPAMAHCQDHRSSQLQNLHVCAFRGHQM